MTIVPSLRPMERLRTYASFVRFEHTLFSLPLILAGIFSMPGAALSGRRWVLVGVAAVGARTAAMALNRIIDRRIDALNPRTRSRELPAGRMKTTEAVALLLVSASAYLVACAALGPWFLKVAFIPLVVFVAYPYLKRFTPLCHAGVGAALALAPLAGFAAAHPDLAGFEAALWLGAFAFFWVSGFDVIYATLDEGFDREHGVRSLVTWLGRERALRISSLLHAGAFLCLGGVAWAILRHTPSQTAWGLPAVGLALAAAGILLHLEQKWAEDVNLAFFKVNIVVGFVVLAVVLLARAAGGF